MDLDSSEEQGKSCFNTNLRFGLTHGSIVIMFIQTMAIDDIDT